MYRNGNLLYTFDLVAGTVADARGVVLETQDGGGGIGSGQHDFRFNANAVGQGFELNPPSDSRKHNDFPVNFTVSPNPGPTGTYIGLYYDLTAPAGWYLRGVDGTIRASGIETAPVIMEAVAPVVEEEVTTTAATPAGLTTPAPIPVPAGERWFTYTWSATSGSNTYSVSGEFRTRSQAVANTVREGDVYYHMLTAQQGTTTLFTLDLMAGTLGGAAANVNMHDFEFALPAAGATGPFAFVEDQGASNGGFFTTELAVADGTADTNTARGNITGLVYHNFNSRWRLFNNAAGDSTPLAETDDSGAPVVIEKTTQ